MLSLDSSKWSDLTHAYGSAENIPNLLRQLSTFPESTGNSEPWFSIWSTLAHQGDVYSASFAAVPHVVSFIKNAPQRVTADFFHFPAWVEICRRKNSVPVPAELLPAYSEALAELVREASAALNREVDEGFLRCGLAAISAGKGSWSLAEAILEMSPSVVPDFWTWFESR